MQNELSRRTLMMFGLGKSGPVVDSGGYQSMQTVLTAAETRDGTAVIQNFGMTSVPPAGSDVAVLFQGGDRAKGLIVGTNHPNSRPRNLTAGQTCLYDQGGTQLRLTSDGNGTLTLSSVNGTFALTGNLTVSGSISAQGKISSAVDVVAGAAVISLVGHLTTDVQSGSGKSGPPVNP